MSPQPLSHLQILLVPLPSTCHLARFTVAQAQEISLLLALQHGLRNGHAFDVFALHGVVPRFAIRLHPFSARNAFTMIFTSSAHLPGTLAALFP